MSWSILFHLLVRQGAAVEAARPAPGAGPGAAHLLLGLMQPGLVRAGPGAARLLLGPVQHLQTNMIIFKSHQQNTFTNKYDNI